MQKFLEQVAAYYVKKLKSTDDLADFIFILPNKRSALFLKRYVQRAMPQGVNFMPRFTTFGKFLSRRSPLIEASHDDKLFQLYNCYRSVLERHGHAEQAKDFDKFIFWGDMILSDFDDIDCSMADARMLYKNLKDLKSITADYLSEEQKKVIRDIWGDTPMTESIGTFWYHTGHGEDHEQPIKRKFLALWQILTEIYEDFVASMRERRLGTKGMIALDAVQSIKNEPIERLRKQKYVFVGHSELNTAELSIMSRLRDAGTADFFWDIASPIFEGNNPSKVVVIIKNLAKQFPMPEDFTLEQVETVPQIDIIGFSSSVGQAKYAANILSEWYNENLAADIDSINTAAVVPQQSLLTPLLLGLDEDIDKINVTMSVPYSTTTFATLFRVIVALQMRARKRSDGLRTFFYEDVLEVLQHPHIQLIAGDIAENIRAGINRDGLYNINAAELAESHPALKYIFRTIDNPNDINDVYKYVVELLDGLAKDLRPIAETRGAIQTMEVDVIEAIRESVGELYLNIKQYDIQMHESTFLIMFEKILNSASLNLNGTPLNGLQVMGVLETRCLDFDNLLFLSMNERTFPRRDYVKTMIPNTLRRGYGLPPIEQSESYYSYYFFRAITRAKRAILMYDSRQGMKGYEMSRYLNQLIYLYDKGNIQHLAVDCNSAQNGSRIIEVAKTDKVMAELEAFKKLGGPKLSASALKTYINCPLHFYLQYVKGIREEDQPKGFITSAMIGDIFHHSMLEIYRPYEGYLINEDTINQILAGDRIEKIVRQETLKVLYNPKKIQNSLPQLTMEAELTTEITARQIRRVLEVEKDTYCNKDSFTYVKGEFDVKDKQWQVTPELKINFRMQIDRIDQISSGHLRFIDYKTGIDDLTIGSKISNLFNKDHTRQGIFQLLVYSEAYNDMVESGIEVTPIIEAPRKIIQNGGIKNITFNKKPLERWSEISSEFRPLVNDLITLIFDDKTPFKQSEGTDSCKFCKFKPLCGKVIPEKKY